MHYECERMGGEQSHWFCVHLFVGAGGGGRAGPLGVGEGGKGWPGCWRGAADSSTGLRPPGLHSLLKALLRERIRSTYHVCLGINEPSQLDYKFS